MDKYVWVKRSQEWIDANPNKGTMYKELLSKVADNESLVKEVRQKRKYITIDKKSSNSGVYIIICEKAKRVYVGQSINISVRIRHHKHCVLINKPYINNIYIKIKEDVLKHGIDSLYFGEYKVLTNPTTEELLLAENAAMYDFLNRGYELYNRSIMGNLYCPDKFKNVIQSFINKLNKNPELINLISKELS